jgi:regulatory protein
MARRSSSRRPKSPPTGTAVESGVRLLARRAHSRAELRQKLVRKGFDPEEVQAALERLAGRGYLDDEAFARGLVRRRSVSRGPLALAAELSAKGIDRAGAAAALAGFDPEAQLATATALAERLYAAKPLPGYRETLDRVGSKLLRRGFSAGVVRAACRAVVVGASPAAGD